VCHINDKTFLLSFIVLFFQEMLAYSSTYIVFYSLVLLHFYLIQKRAPYPLIDEIFHVPQAQKYCAHEFRYWDSKITTPPGLYLFSVILREITRFSCTITFLRATNILNVFLIHILVKRITGNHMKAIAVASNPLLLTFSCLYYIMFVHTTDEYFVDYVWNVPNP